jgi:lipopolysaccharide assembly protein A
MRFFFLLLKAFLFLLLFGFAFKNADDITVRYFLGLEWQAPLVLVLLVFVGLGIAGGVMASLSIIVRQRREILALKRELRSLPHAPAAPAMATAEFL